MLRRCGCAIVSPRARGVSAEISDASIAADVGTGPMAGKPGAFGIAVKMAITVPGMERAAAQKLVAPTHEVCPYSKATRGNIDAVLSVVKS